MALPLPPHLLHFALPVGNLDASLDFFKSLGMQILKQDEFPAGGEGQFLPLKGGPKWSRTMVGYVSEASSLSLGIKHNPTLSSYKVTDTVKFLVSKIPAGAPKHGQSGLFTSPDGYQFEVAAELPAGVLDEPRIYGVELAVRDPEERADLLSRILGASSPTISHPTPTTVRVDFPYKLSTPASVSGPSDANAFLQLTKVSGNPDLSQPMDHGDLVPRMAVAVQDVDATHERAVWLLEHAEEVGIRAKFRITVPPMTGPGRHGMRLFMLRNADGYEYAFVSWDGFLASQGIKTA